MFKMMIIILFVINLISTYAFFPNKLNFPTVIGNSKSFQLSKKIASVEDFSTKNIVRVNLSKVRISSPLYFKVTEAQEEDVTDISDLQPRPAEFDSTKFMKKISNGMVPIAASIGFAVTPSSAVAVRFAGAAIGGIAGVILRSLVAPKEAEVITDDDNNIVIGSGQGSTEVVTAIEFITRKNSLREITSQTIEKAAKRNRLNPEQLSELYTTIFAEVVYQIVQDDDSDLMALEEIVEFADNLGLTTAEIGDGFVLAVARVADNLEKDASGFYLQEYDYRILLQASKVLFIGEKMIGSLDGFYGKRFATSLSFFENNTYKEIITAACTTLFRRCVESVIMKPSDFSVEEVSKLRQFLLVSPTISELRDATMQNLIMEILTYTIESRLANGEKFASMEDMNRIEQILGWNHYEFVTTIETKTVPAFESYARKIIDTVAEEPEKADELAIELIEKRDALNVPERMVRSTLMTIVSQKNAAYMEMIDKVQNSTKGGTLTPVFKLVASYSTQHAAMKKVLDATCSDADLPTPGLPFADMVRESLYDMQLRKPVKGLDIEQFQLTDEQQRKLIQNLALPKVTTWIAQCIKENNFDPGAKAAYEKLLASNSVTPEQWRATSVDFYYQEVKAVAESRAVPGEVDMIRLEKLRGFLGVSDDLADKVMLEHMGDKYVKAVSECMMPTGVVTEEYVDGLERLRKRLRLSEVEAEQLLGLTTRQRIIPVVKDLVDQWKIATGQAKRKDEANQKDKSGDPISSLDNVLGYMESGQKDKGGVNVFMREALNLVDFFLSNYQIQGIDLKEKDVLPVNAVGIVPVEELVGMLKHYIITRLTEQDPGLRNRYIENEPIFAKVLGITTDQLITVKESLAYTAYKNMLKNVFRNKDAADPQDIQQFTILKQSLGLSEEISKKIVIDASREAISDHASSLFKTRKGTPPVTAAIAQRFRSQVQSLGLSLQKDVRFNDNLIGLLFAIEAQYLIENGLEDEIQDIQQAYELPEEVAEMIVGSVCKRYVSQLLNLALRASAQFKETECMDYVKEILKYAKFFEGSVDADGLFFTEADKERLISFHESEANAEDGGLNADEHNIVVRLRELINLTSNYQAPAGGIDGLLDTEGAKGSVSLEKMKKQWAWS